MKTKTRSLLLTVAIAVSLVTTANADDARLKETLRTLTGRLRSAEAERNTLLSDKAQLEQEKKTLSAKVDVLNKQVAADKAQLDTLEAKQREFDETKQSLAKWKAAYEQIQTAAQKSEAERTKLASEAIILKRKVEDRERKNLELYKTANEVLTRYEKFGLGEALSAKEPFTGITRVKLESQVQDYEDKIADNKVKPDEPTGQQVKTEQTVRKEKPEKK
jgi:chromosome segregation ATPase